MSTFSLDELKRTIKQVMKEEQRDREPSMSNNERIKKNVDIVCEDGECYKGVIEKMKKDSKVVCSHCGLGLGSKEMAKDIENCPNCGSEDAEEREEQK